MTYCSEIHHGLHLYPDGENNIWYAPCCVADKRKIENDFFDFQTDPYLQSLREQNKNNVKNTECNFCWKEENLGGTSKRQSGLDFTIDNSGLEIFEYNVNWACNLTCIMCGPHFSSSWAKELGLKDNQNQIDRRKNYIIDQVDLSNVKRIHFNGGEPLINDDHVRILGKINNIQEVKITYNTNGTKLPSDRAIRLWENSHHVRLFFSIDAVGSAFEYIRYPGNWDQLQANMDWFIKQMPSNVIFGINATIGSYNLLETVDLYNWFKQTLFANREGDASDFCWQPANNFDYKNLSDVVKQDALDKLKNCKPLESLYNSVKSQMNNIPNDNWIQKLDEIDLRRGTSWQQSLKIGEYYK